MRNLIKNNDGNILITAAIVLPVLIFVVLASVDFMKVSKTQVKFETAVDNALTSAVAKSVSDVPSETAREYFNVNFVGEEGFKLDSLKVDFDSAKREWSVEANANMTTFLGMFGGEDGFNLSHSAKVKWDTESLVELVFTVDNSASMCMETVRSEKEDGSMLIEYLPDSKCTKLNAMKEALTNIIDEGITPLESLDNGPTYKVGIVPFNHKVKMPKLGNLPTPLTSVEVTHAKGSANYFTNFDDAEPLAPVKPLVSISNHNDVAELRNHVNSITQEPEGLGWTRSNIAALASAMMLDNSYHSSYGGARPADLNDPNVEKIVVLMTDGANMGCCYAAHPEGNFANQYLYLYDVDNAHLLGLDKTSEMLGNSYLRNWKDAYAIPEKGLCKQMKENGITIYSVVFDVDDRDSGGKQIKDALKECASNEQYYFDVADGDELKLAYQTIAQSLIKLRLVK